MNGDELIQDALELHQRALEARAVADDLTGQRNAAVRRALENGAGAIAVAAAFGVDRQRIYQMAARDRG